ncbi:MAG TPA: amino acid ABC transporter permease [Rhabdochlamydiaceae bacterium]|nr:amino acid ABC transporter permease [Rhabdochlamydiaceae bacterium]
MNTYLELFLRCAPLLLKGTVMTLQVLLGSALLSFSLGTVMGILSCKRLKIPLISPIVEGIAFVFRAIPFYVQLLIVYFVLPDLMRFNLEPFSASVISLGMCSAGYVAQIVRGGLNAIPPAQWEAADALGYTTQNSLRYIVLPQMLKTAVPAFNNELDALLKSTAVVSSIGMLELTRIGMNLVSREMEPVPIYLTVALFYLCMSALLNGLARKFEQRISYVKY